MCKPCVPTISVAMFNIWQGSSIYSDTAAKNYGSWDVFGLQVPRIPAKRLGTTEEVCIWEFSISKDYVELH